jgi:hypothetical protein
MPLFAVAYAQLTSLQNQIPKSSKGMPVTMEVVNVMKNMEINPEKDTLIIKESGVYCLYASGTLGSVNKNAVGYLDLWYLKNGKAISNSNYLKSLDRVLSTGTIISEIVTFLEAGDRLSIHFSTSKPYLGLVNMHPEHEPAISTFLFSIFKTRDFK